MSSLANRLGVSTPTDADAPKRSKRMEAAAFVPEVVDPLEQLKSGIQESLYAELGPRLSDAALSPREVESLVLEGIERLIAQSAVSLTAGEQHDLVLAIRDDVLGLGPIQPLLEDPSVSEVMVNGPNAVFVERAGMIELTSTRFASEQHLRQIIDRIVAPIGRRVDESSPMVDARLADGSRVNAIIAPLAVGGSSVTIRKFPDKALTVADLIRLGSLTQEAADFLKACVAGGLNVVVSGGTGTGKTTLLNLLSGFIPERERVVTIEDAVELRLKHQNLVNLEARPANAEGVGEVTIRDLVRNSLRMRPDRIVIGECRGGEALDMLQAMNTGHEGSLTTIHANTPRDLLSRLETMILMAGVDLPSRAIRDQIASAIQLIVQLHRMHDGRRAIVAVTETAGMESDRILLSDIYAFDWEAPPLREGLANGRLVATGIRPQVEKRLRERGCELAPSLFEPPRP